MNKINTAKYLATKFKYKGENQLLTDCYGLCRQIAADVNKPIPDVNYEGYHMRQTHFLIEREMKKEKLWNKVKPKEDTIAVFRINGVISHVGYMISETEFIHIQKETNVQITKINDPLWKLLLVGCYKYIGN